MELSLPGLIVCLTLVLVGLARGAPLIIALFLSLAFGSTAIGTLVAIGGSSPLIYTMFLAALLMATLMRRTSIDDFVSILTRFRVAWLVLAVVCYAIVSAYFFPQLLSGMTTVFVTAPRGLAGDSAKIGGAVVEALLDATAGNFTQTAYFVLGALTFFSLAIWMRGVDRLTMVCSGFFAMATCNAALGSLDLTGKLIGIPDILDPIRTASYSMATTTIEAGFWRIAGGHAEASAFASHGLASLAFAFAYWRATGARSALVLALLLLALLVLSTSTTAYLGLIIGGMVVAAAIAGSVLKQRLRRADCHLMAFGVIAVTAALAVAVSDPKIANAFADLFDTAVLNKASSSSAAERGYWNQKSLQSLWDTGGLGLGFGSSRAASWIVAVISQLGIIGSLMLAAIVAEFALGKPADPATASGIEIAALERGARACGLAVLVAASLSAGSADPGVLFFICLAVVLVCREHLARMLDAAEGPREDTRYRRPSFGPAT